MILKNERLILRPLKNNDAESIVANINNLNISRWLLLVPHPYSLKNARDWIKLSQKNWQNKPVENYTFGIELKSKRGIIGGIEISHVNRDSRPGSVGYWLGEDYHCKGYGTEALRAVADFAFHRLKLRRLEACVFDGNPSSGKLLEKIGFVYEGKKLQAGKCKATGKIHDENIYGLLGGNYL